MKRIALAALVFSMLAVPMAQAQPRQDGLRPQYSQGDNNKSPRYLHKRPYSKGDRVPEWGQHNVSDYDRHGLWRPKNTQQWVKIYDDFLLISTASGTVMAVVADY